MNRISALSLLLLLFVLAPSARADSAFSAFIAKTNGGKPPKTLEELDKLISKGGESIISVEVTPSRSTQKDRMVKVFAVNGKKIFVGFSTEKDELEVISEDIGSKPPSNTFETYKALKTDAPKHDTSDSKCTGCHQHGGPIFSRDPWREMPRSRGSARIFDEAVRDFNAEFQSRRVCASACAKGDFRCRGAILYMALTQQRANRSSLAPDDFFNEAAAEKPPRFGRLIKDLPADILALQKNLEASWPADGYAYTSSVIRDRTPDGKKTALREGKTASGENVDFSDNVVSLSEEEKETFETDVVKAKELADPRGTRPLTRAIPKSKALSYLSNFSMTCLGLAQNDEDLHKMTNEQIKKALDSSAVKQLLKDDTWLASGEAIKAAIQKGVAEETKSDKPRARPSGRRSH